MVPLLFQEGPSHALRQDSSAQPLDRQTQLAYRCYMEAVSQKATGKAQPTVTPCLCTALRQASHTVTRIYELEFRGTGLRTTRYPLLKLIPRIGEVSQGDLGKMASLDETPPTHGLRPLGKSGGMTIRTGADRQERLVAITDAGKPKVEQAGPAWLRVQERFVARDQKRRGIPCSRRGRTSRRPPQGKDHEPIQHRRRVRRDMVDETR